MNKPKYVNPQEKNPALFFSLSISETFFAFQPLFNAVLDFFCQLDAYLSNGNHVYKDLFLSDMDVLASYCLSLAPTGVNHVKLYNAMFDKNLKLSELDAHIEQTAPLFNKNNVPASYKRLEEDFALFDLTPEDTMEAMEGYWALVLYFGHDMGESHYLPVMVALWGYKDLLNQEEKSFAHRFGKLTPGEIRLAEKNKK